GARTRGLVLVGDHHVRVERRHRRRPPQPQLVVELFGDHGHQARHADAVRTHGQPYRLAVLAEHVRGERVGVLAAELEDVADLEAACRHEPTRAVGGRVAVPYLGGLDGAVGDEITTGDQTHDVLARLVGAGDPGRAVHHARIDEITNTVGQ